MMSATMLADCSAKYTPAAAAAFFVRTRRRLYPRGGLARYNMGDN